MATGIWVLDLIDRVTAPAGAIDRALIRLDNRITNITRSTTLLAGRLGSLGAGFRAAEAAGAASASRLSAAWNGVHNSISRSQQGMRSLVGTAAGLAATGAAVGYVGKTVLDAAGLREMQITQISTLMKERDKSKVVSAVDWINRFADETPFTDEQTMKLVRQSMGYGFNFDQTKGVVRIIGDASNLVADNPSDAAFRASAVIRAIGQIKSKGKLMQQEVNQIAEHIPGITTALDAAFGGGANRMKLQMKGQISSNKALSVIFAAMNDQYGGGMDVQSKQLLGLASTLKSRPQRIMGMLTDMGGLEQPKRFFTNLVNLTDNKKDPGKRILGNLAQTGKRMVDAIFGPLADATEGQRAERLVNKLSDQLDKFTDWWTTNGPRIAREARGFGDGLRAAGDGASMLLKPLVGLAGLADKAGGGDGQGMLGKILGFSVGAVVLARLGNFLSFGALGALGRRAGTALIGSIARSLAAGGLLNYFGRMWPVLLRSARAVGWLRALGLAELGTTIGRIGFSGLLTTGARAIPVIGWIITGITALKAVGDALYRRFEGFANLMDDIRSKMSWMMSKPEEQTTALGRALAFDPIKWATGQQQAWEIGNDKFTGGLQAMAGRLGINPNDLLKVIGFESGFDPAARNKDSGASGLLQMLPSTLQEYGISAGAFRRLGRAEQLPYIERYLKDHGVTAGMGLEQLYMSVLRGNPATGTLWSRGTTAYRQNAGLDANLDGIITSREALAAVENRWAKDGAGWTQELHIHVQGNVDQATLDAIGRAARPDMQTLGIEGGY